MQDFGDSFCLTLLTSDPALAAEADRAGVDRVGLDFERLDKAARQAGHDTRMSDHSLDDLARIARCLTRADSSCASIRSIRRPKATSSRRSRAA